MATRSFGLLTKPAFLKLLSMSRWDQIYATPPGKKSHARWTCKAWYCHCLQLVSSQAKLICTLAPLATALHTPLEPFECADCFLVEVGRAALLELLKVGHMNLHAVSFKTFLSVERSLGHKGTSCGYQAKIVGALSPKDPPKVSTTPSNSPLSTDL